MTTRYKIVYSGSLKPGTEPEQFVRRFMELFKVPEANARKLVSMGQAVTLKTKLEQAQAEKLREAMDGLGMQVTVEPMADAGEGGVARESNPGAAAASSGPRCPKCGSERVKGDDCLACGVIISRYKERQGRLAEAAAARGEDAPGPSGEDAGPGMVSAPRVVPAGNAWRWIADGWGYFRQNPGAWIGAMLIWLLLLGVSSVIPFVGALAANILGPVFSAGFLLGANEQREGGNFEVRHLFAGFSRHTGPLALVGVLYLVGMVAIIAVGAFIFGGTLFAMGGSMGTLDVGVLGGIAIMFLVILALMIPLLMAYWFAPALVALGGMSPVDAMKASFTACLKNMLPFLLYGVWVFLLALAALIPLGLGFLVLGPVVIASIFTSYRDIFFPAENA